MQRDTWADSERVSLSWQFELLLWDISPWFLLANCFYLPGSKSISGISQDPPMCAHSSLSQDGFSLRGLWIISTAPLLTSKEPFQIVQSGRSSDFKNEKYGVSYILSGQGPTSSLTCPTSNILEFRSTGNESPITLPWQTYLPPASKPNPIFLYLLRVQQSVGPERISQHPEGCIWLTDLFCLA